MNHIVASTKCAAISILFSAFLFVACGDESSVSSNPVTDSSSDTEMSSSDKGSPSSSSSSKKTSSSSSRKDVKMSSSEEESVSSSSGYVLRDSLCSSEYEGGTKYISQYGITYRCINGHWVLQSSSSTVSSSSSSKYYDMSRLFVSENDYSYGEFTDPRDGQVYKTISYEHGFRGIDSITFFAQNLNYGRMIPGGTQMTDSTKFCYDDDPWYCENGFGGLYTWATVMNFPAACDSFAMGSAQCPEEYDLMSNPVPEYQNNLSLVIHRGICPEGWHVMNEEEWATVMKGRGSRDGASYLGAVLWGSNQRGFSLLPAGKLHSDGPHSYYINMDKSAYHWLPGEYKNEENGYVGGLVAYVTYDHLTRGAGEEKFYGLSIRCTKDY
ncbi:MAG: hypothetical protein IJ912_02455 [Fibrobacter sp.]|nr:hypothetical protein [Fibrobacter sp.]MBR6125683.1 hypothetical protein [Candidatus Saccharibacteria bacterium]